MLQRLEAIESKMYTIEHLENLDKKVHDHINKLDSDVDKTLKMLKENCRPIS